MNDKPRSNITFDLLLEDRKVIQWNGFDGIDASKRYVASHPEAVVIAWRPVHQTGLHFGLKNIID